MNIRIMTAEDKPEITEMMRVFYSSPAVFTNGSEEIFAADVDECISGSQYLEGYIFEDGGEILGYSMLAKSFSTEFGKRCIWIEDIYVKDEYRGQGIASKFFEFIYEKYDGCLFRLEVEEENERARRVYEKCGFEVLPYMEMKR